MIGNASFTARVRHAEPVMGTVVSFDVPVTARHDGSLDDAVRWLHWVDRVFSPYRPDSDVSQLADGAVTVDGCAPEMAEVIEACAFVRELSGGYFTASPWGRFDPSGYVKGWAVERAAAHPVRRRLGEPPGQRRRRRAVRGRPPGRGHQSRRRAGAGAAVAGGHRRPAARAAASPWSWRPGTAASPRRGRPSAARTSSTREPADAAAGLASVTVVGPSLALADACATAAFAMGPGLARDWTESLDGYEAYAITEAGDTWQTTGFAARIARD